MSDDSYNPLKRAEEILGCVESWPTYILLHLFYEKPGVRVMKNVAAFMHGNGVPEHIAGNCYVACRGQTHVGTILNAICSCYKTWDRYPCDKHVAQYYNMRSKRVLWLNGRNRDPEKLALPEAIVLEIGPKGAKKIGLGWEEELMRANEIVRTKSTSLL